MSGLEHPTPEALQALEQEGAWLHSLAQSLCKDPGLAADAAQLTLEAGWSRGPARSDERRPWLARVLRNRLNQEHRSDRRRQRRELGRARPSAGAAADEILERLELQELVAASLRELEEPYRSVLVLRFLDGLPPRRVATRLGLSVSTVKGRIERGLEQLRRQLDQRCRGGREIWLRGLLMLPAPSGALPLLTGASAMSSGTKVAGGLVAAGLMVWGSQAWWHSLEPDPAPQQALVQEQIEAVSEGPAELEPAVPEGGREVVLANEPALPATRRLEARVVDLEGTALEGVRVGLQRTWPLEDVGEPRESAELGIVRFELTGDPRADEHATYSLTCLDSDWAALQLPIVEAGGEELPDMVVVPAREVSGFVVDPNGAAVVGAKLRMTPPVALVRSIDTGQPRKASPIWQGETTREGRFLLEGTPHLEGLTLELRCGGYEAVQVELQPGDARDLRVVMERLEAGENVVSGRVLGPDGLPKQGAVVSCGGASMRSDATGWFAVRLPDEEQERLLEHIGQPFAVRAAAEGHLPAQEVLDPDAPEQPFVILQLGGPPLSIQGRLQGAESIEGDAWVWLSGLQPLGHVVREVGAGRSRPQFHFVEDWLRTGPGRGGWGALTLVKADRSFELTGLLDQEYTLHAYGKTGLRLADPLPVRAGERNVLIALPAPPNALTVRGRVLDRTGQPLPKMQVSLSRQLPVPGFVHPGGMDMRTDEEGRFAFAGVTFGEWLDVHVDDRSGSDLPKSEGYYRFRREELLEELELVVAGSLRVRVRTQNLEYLACEVMLLDEAGDALSLSRRDGAFGLMSGSMELVEGDSGILVVPDDAVTLYVKGEGRAPLRLPIELQPGSKEIQELRIP